MNTEIFTNPIFIAVAALLIIIAIWFIVYYFKNRNQVKQVEEAKKKKLKARITRDVVFIILGITFLAISIVMSVVEKNNEEIEKQQI